MVHKATPNLECDECVVPGLLFNSITSCSEQHSGSHDRVTGKVGDATEIATVSCHEDVAFVTPALTPAVKRDRSRQKKQEKKRINC